MAVIYDTHTLCINNAVQLNNNNQVCITQEKSSTRQHDITQMQQLDSCPTLQSQHVEGQVAALNNTRVTKTQTQQPQSVRGLTLAALSKIWHNSTVL